MSEMKAMTYQKDRKMEVLYKGEYKNYKFVILSLGTHPAAFVENRNNLYDCNEANTIFKNRDFPHGDFCFCKKPYWDEIDKTIYLGWDYARGDDFSGNDIGGNDPYIDNLKKWSTEEIYKEVENVIDFLFALLNSRITDTDIEDAIKCCMTPGPGLCYLCAYKRFKGPGRCIYMRNKDTLDYINRLKSEKQLAETQLKELLSALYKLTGNEWQSYNLCRSDILGIAKDYGIKEEELKTKLQCCNCHSADEKTGERFYVKLAGYAGQEVEVEDD